MVRSQNIYYLQHLSTSFPRLAFSVSLHEQKGLAVYQGDANGATMGSFGTGATGALHVDCRRSFWDSSLSIAMGVILAQQESPSTRLSRFKPRRKKGS